MAGRDLTESQIQELLLDDDSDNDSTCSDDSVRDPDWNFPNSSGDEDELPNQDEEKTIHSRKKPILLCLLETYLKRRCRKRQSLFLKQKDHRWYL